MKVTVPVSYNVNMKTIYSQVKPLIPKKEFLTKIKDYVKDYVQARLEAETDTDYFCLDDMINWLVCENYAEFIEC